MTVLDAFIDFRKEVVLRRSKYQLAEIEKRMHILEGLVKAISVLDEVIMIIRELCVENFTSIPKAIKKGVERIELCDNLAVPAAA